MTSQLDTSVFRDPVPAEEIAAQRPTGIAGLVAGSRLFLAGFAAACLAVWLVCSMGIAEAAVDSFNLDASAVNVGSGIFLAGLLAAAVGFLLQGAKEDPRITAAKLSRFVQRNGLSYKEDPKLPRIDATIFGEGHHPQSSKRFRNGPAHPFPFEVAHFSYRTGSRSRNRNDRPSVITWTYAAVTAERRLPRMLLDAKGNDPWFGSSVPVSLAKSQQVPLPEDLDRHFTLYAPEGHEAAALAVFTPEVLRRLLAEAPGFDVETVDDSIVFFTRGELDLGSQGTWERLSQVIFGPGAALVGMANGPVSAQRFASGAAQTVPPEGRTLKRRTLTPALIWTLAGFAVLVLARLLLTGPLNGLI
ncbi:hypothetical protein [Arthrobacter sp. zg-Y179]|uniref:hypothetical protein n=1 Tax=Arthrobacter sp. zg-Y179 TaxID=2894188 RepID=UPI001E4D05E9|nr:hypothetical protein [Arthrobacter sp. zg-Y179]MCC9175196.1 hypothetical protein [Arthrobacter sp. zg-Y179]